MQLYVLIKQELELGRKVEGLPTRAIEMQAVKATSLPRMGKEMSTQQTVVKTAAYMGTRVSFDTFCSVPEKGRAPSLEKAQRTLQWQQGFSGAKEQLPKVVLCGKIG